MSALNGVLLSEHVGVARILRLSDSALRLFSDLKPLGQSYGLRSCDRGPGHDRLITPHEFCVPRSLDRGFRRGWIRYGDIFRVTVIGNLGK